MFAPTALRAIGANKCAAVVENTLRTISRGDLPADQAKRQEIDESLSDEVREKLKEIDAEFFAYPDNLSDLLFAFVKSYPRTFGPIP